ncbi:FUN14 domain-containing protein [Deinococcus sp. YIM 77859]|uniref:FUN14 domain-containing protein n=1 Tax=Deinococcus sp. YIM 77859 TaxID=1540221 RepID=UPI00054E284E|nr:FUN14 domain-containing protein [Deinococcus sp. YIM 77859]
MAPDTLSAAPITEALRLLLPDLSVGMLLGFATGLALKRIVRLALLALGLLLITVQLLAFFDLLTVNWPRVQALAAPLLPGGGPPSGAWLGRVLTANLPFAGAFTAGVLVGVRARG